MSWDAKKFIAEYNQGECDNPRCKNRKDALDEQRGDLLDAQTVLRKVMARAKQDMPNSRVARDIYQAIADYNLGHRDPADDGPGIETRELPSV